MTVARNGQLRRGSAAVSITSSRMSDGGVGGGGQEEEGKAEEVEAEEVEEEGEAVLAAGP